MGNISYRNNNQITLKDGANVDAFGRLRTSDPYVVFDSQNQYNTTSILWETSLTGSAEVAHLPNESSVRFRTTTASGDKVIRQTKQYFRYQPGKSLLVVMTAVLGARKTGVRQRIGYFDSNNGLFFEQTASDLKVVVRSKASGVATDTAISQINWNLDKFDGTGPSGVDIDLSKVQIFIIDMQWLGVGRVRFGFVVNGKTFYCHQVVHANILEAVYMTTANLPARLELENVSSTESNTDLKQICISINSESGYDKDGIPFSAANGVSGISTSTRRPVLSIRPKLTFNSIENRSNFILETFDILSLNQTIFYEIVYNGTLSGASFNAIHSDSAMEYDVAASSISGGQVLTSGYIFSTSSGNTKISNSHRESFSSKLPLSLNMAGDTADRISIVGTSLTSTATVYGSISWRELYS